MQQDFTLSDFLAQLTQVAHRGPSRVMGGDRASDIDVQVEAQVRWMRGLCCAMTAWEREHPEQLNAGRRRRIAAGAAVDTAEVDVLIRQFEMSRRIMRYVRASL